jgi:hypothetical protein
VSWWLILMLTCFGQKREKEKKKEHLLLRFELVASPHPHTDTDTDTHTCCCAVSWWLLLILIRLGVSKELSPLCSFEFVRARVLSVANSASCCLRAWLPFIISPKGLGTVEYAALSVLRLF